MKVLCADGVRRTFTQRGKDPSLGFVRVKGRTVVGFVFGNPVEGGTGRFEAWIARTNGMLLSPQESYDIQDE
jgi:hypothetical protein